MVIDRSWNSKTPLVFAHVVLTETLSIRWVKKIRARISHPMDLWKRDLQTGLVGDADAEGALRVRRSAID